MRVLLQSAYVLHTRPWRDSSALVDLFSSDHGRVSLLAKGARTGRRSRGGSRAALLQPFVPLLCSWSGRSSLRTCTGCEPRAAALALRGQRLYCGLYVNELTSRLLHREDPHPRLFEHYERALTALGVAEDCEQVLRQFEFRLLEELGYGFELIVDGRSGEPVEPGCEYRFHQEYGLVRETAEVGQAGSFNGADLHKLSRGEFDASSRHCAKRLMRVALASHLGDKPLKSRELFARE